jgi:pullulanase
MLAFRNIFFSIIITQRHKDTKLLNPYIFLNLSAFVPLCERIIKYVIYTTLAVSMLFLSCAKKAEPALTVHYYRYNGDYAGWNVWAWPSDPNGDGKGFAFEPDKDGQDGFITARLFFKDGAGTSRDIREIGVIIRKSDKGDDWAEKDTSDDRFTTEKEIWLVQGDHEVYAAKPEIRKSSILFAVADAPTTIKLALSATPDDYGSFAVYEGERRLPGVSQKDAHSRYAAVISLEEPIDDTSKAYIVRDESKIFRERNVVMRNILDSYYYDGDDLGLNCSEKESFFKVWAPTAASVSVALYDTMGEYNADGKVVNNETDKLHPMQKDKSGLWSAVLPGNFEGKFYLYRVLFADGSAAWTADPYAKAVTANGQRMAIVRMDKTNPVNWQPRRKPPFAAGRWQDAVIYELHVRDFSIDENSGMKNKGKFLAFTERGTVNSEGASTGVDHLVKLGITHVHLLPSFDFASLNELAQGGFNWGYDPMHYNVPEGSYSTDPKNPVARITEFKAMVQSLHDSGLRVITDVVYNHTYQSGGWPFDSLVPGYYYRVNDDGKYSNGSACGNEIASERPMVRKFIIDSCKYWAREYGIDGFRFDLMGLIDTLTMKQLTEELRRIDPTIIIYGEPWQAGGSILPKNLQTVIGAQKELGFAVFNDRLRSAIKGGSDDATRGFVTDASLKERQIVLGVTGSINDFTRHANESVNYVTAHDNLNLWDKFASSHGAAQLKTSPYSMLEGVNDLFENDVVKSVLLANGIIFTSQGIPFFQAGDEMLRSKFGDHNSYTSPDNVNKIRWENASRFHEVFDYYAGLIQLRKEHPAFRMNTKEDIEKNLEVISAEDLGVSFALKGTASGDSWRNIFVAYNGSNTPKEFPLPVSTSAWRQVVDNRRAGVKTLAEFTGSVTLPPVSMTVLHD